MAACTSITFETEITRAKFDAIGFLKQLLKTYNVNGLNGIMYVTQINSRNNSKMIEFNFFLNKFCPRGMMQPRGTTLKISYKSRQFVGLKRTEHYTKIDFLANCGGLLGFFVGASILSIIEIIYYFILRLPCSLRFHGQYYRNRTNKIAPSDARKYFHKKLKYGSSHQVYVHISN